MKTAIQRTISEMNDVASAWGIGSFFRNEPYRDIDLVLVLEEHVQPLAEVHQRISASLSKLSSRWQVRIDVTVLTQNEFAEGLINEKMTLVHMNERRRPT